MRKAAVPESIGRDIIGNDPNSSAAGKLQELSSRAFFEKPVRPVPNVCVRSLDRKKTCTVLIRSWVSSREPREHLEHERVARREFHRFFQVS